MLAWPAVCRSCAPTPPDCPSRFWACRLPAPEPPPAPPPPPTPPPSPRAVFEANPWWAVKLPQRRAVASIAIQTTTECACVADLVGARILVGSQPWTGPASAANFTLCAEVAGIVRGQRKVFKCGGAGGGPPAGEYLAIWRPSTSKKQLTLCEVDAEFAPEAQAVPEQPPSPTRRRLLSRRLRSAAAAVAAALAGQPQHQAARQ